MRISLLLFVTLAIHGQIICQVPTISSFSPASGSIGTQVTISGKNFDPDPSKNSVFFGAVRATVLTAGNQALTVEVPPGTTHELISVATNGLVAFSDRPFIQTFVTRDTTLNRNSFSFPIKFGVPQGPGGIVAADLDGDGKTEVIVSTVNEISVFRNMSSKRNIQLSKIDFPLGGARNVSVCDINGDGWPDLVTSNGSGTISVIPNKSNLGFLTLLAPLEFAMGQGTNSHLAFQDIDGDGRTDISGTDGNNTTLVLKNTTANNVISFAPVKRYPAGLQPQGSFLRDLDGDKKPDLVVSNLNAPKISIYRNTSNSDSISFDFPWDIPAPTLLGLFSVGDIDGDGEPDIVAANRPDSSILIFRNISTVNDIQFEVPKRFMTGININDLCIQDFDGDARPDIAGVSFQSNSLAVLKNRSNLGNVSMQETIQFPTGPNPAGVAAGDFDGDGKTDLAVANFQSDSISIHRNTVGETTKIALCPPLANTSIVTELSGQNYRWQVDTGMGFTNIINNAAYTGETTISLQLVNIPTSWYGYKYRCVVDFNISNMFELKFVNEWKGAVNNLWSNASNWSCGTLPDSNTDVLISSGAIVLNSNVTVRSLVLNPGATVKVGAGFNLAVLH